MPFDQKSQSWERFAEHVQQLQQALLEGKMAEIDSLLCEHHKFITSLSIQPLNDLEKSEALLVSIQARVIEILNVAEQRRQELRTLIIEASKQKEQIIAYTAASHLTS